MFLGTVFIQVTCNSVLTYIVPDPHNYVIDFTSESFRIKKTFGSALYCAVVFFIQYKVSQGLEKIFWFSFILYEGCLIFRIYCFLEKFIPGSLKPFPYFNLVSSSNIVLLLIIGKELGGLYLLPQVFAAMFAIYLYISMMKRSLELSINSPEELSTYFDQTLHGYNQSLENGYPSIRNNIGSIAAWLCFFSINISLTILGLARDGDSICLAGLYGLYEMVWEISLVDPHWARRKVIVIKGLVKCFYNSEEVVVEQNETDDQIFTKKNNEQLMFAMHYAVKLMIVGVYLTF